MARFEAFSQAHFIKHRPIISEEYLFLFYHNLHFAASRLVFIDELVLEQCTTIISPQLIFISRKDECPRRIFSTFFAIFFISLPEITLTCKDQIR